MTVLVFKNVQFSRLGKKYVQSAVGKRTWDRGYHRRVLLRRPTDLNSRSKLKKKKETKR